MTPLKKDLVPEPTQESATPVSASPSFPVLTYLAVFLLLGLILFLADRYWHQLFLTCPQNSKVNQVLSFSVEKLG